jgi:hypothetical protein
MVALATYVRSTCWFFFQLPCSTRTKNGHLVVSWCRCMNQLIPVQKPPRLTSAAPQDCLRDEGTPALGSQVTMFRISNSNVAFAFRIRISHLCLDSFLTWVDLIAFPSAVQSTADAAPQRHRQTKRPANPAERCKFRFNVCFSDDKSRWFFKKQGSGCSTHIGHCHLDPKQARASSAALEKEEEHELVLQQLQMNIPIDSIRALLEKRTDTNCCT